MKKGVLNFKKDSLIELNSMELNGVNGGSSPPCFFLGVKTAYWIAGAFVVGVGVGVYTHD